MPSKILKKYIWTTISCFLCLSSYAQSGWDKERETVKMNIKESGLGISVSFLADTLCGGRATGTRGSSEAAFWIERQFSQAGLLPLGKGYAMAFRTQAGAKAHNIIGFIPGSLTMPRDRYIIVGAHYDHLGELGGIVYPGADANASGTVAMTSLAQMFAQMREMGKVYDSSIIFVAFDAKEHDLAGSGALWDAISEGELTDPVSGKQITKGKISLMVNIDQVGSTLSPISKNRKDYLIMLGTPSLKQSRKKVLEQVNSANGIDMELALDYYGSRNFTKVFYRLSDQRIFVDNKVPAVLFTSGITMNTNKTRDTAASLDMQIFRKRIELMFHWLEEML